MKNFTPAALAAALAENPDVSLTEPDALTEAPPRRVQARTEAALQAAVIAECDRRSLTDARWSLLMAIPNGQYRRGQRPEPGIRAGVPDLLLPLASRGYISAWLELKVGRNVLSEKQKAWHRALREHGHFVCTVYDDPQAAIDVLVWYIEGSGRDKADA